MLQAYVHMLEGTTFTTERLHSKNGRRTLARRMTHQQDVAGLAAFHQSMAAPRWATDFITPSPADRAKPKAAVKKAAKSRGGGGAWRAMVHAKRSLPDESGHKPTFRELGVIYRSLSAEEQERYQDIGAKATKLRKLVSGPSFPKTSAAVATAHRLAAARESLMAERQLDAKRMLKEVCGWIRKNILGRCLRTFPLNPLCLRSGNEFPRSRNDTSNNP